jgi:uncharacterized protein (DUF1684 family)
MSEWKLIGSCGVDSGTIMLVDPCYVIADKDVAPRVTYEDTLEAWRTEGHDFHDMFIPFEDGVIVSSGYGDGNYPVYAKFDEDGRLMEVKVDFNVWV